MFDKLSVFLTMPAFWFVVVIVLGACAVTAIFERRQEDTR